LILSFGAHAQTDVLFQSGFEDRPNSDAEAARFLTQATFGPNRAAISELRQNGYSSWFASQNAAAISLQRPIVEERIAALALANPQPGPAYRRIRLERWWDTAARGPDQLRQRMAYALSQILVISDITLNGNATMVAEYHDILARNALGNFRVLLEDVARSPMMALYLTYLRNPKTEWTFVGGTLTPGTIAPDENFAREVMQLFTIGLIERNRDFSPILVGGQTVPTYNQDVITQTARLLTGFSARCTGNATIGGIALNRNCNCTGTQCQFSTQLYFAPPPSYVAGGSNTGLVHPDGYAPMVCYPRYNDSGRSSTNVDGFAVLPAPFNIKTIIAGITLQPSPVPCHAGTPAGDQQSCINYCDNQLDTLLDALFMHPNLPPMVARQLIQRFTTSTPSPQYIERVAMVFENDGNAVRGNLAATIRAVLMDPEARGTPSANSGKLREPLLKLTSLWRAFDVAAGTAGDYNINQPETALAQRPLGAPTVFNFYEPDYLPPGELAQAGIFGPELQILSEATSVSGADFFYQRVFAGYATGSLTQTPFTAPNVAHLPPSAIDALPTDADALVNELNIRLMYGSMSNVMRDKLIALITGPMAAADARRKSLSLIHLILISPEYAAQR
jgi:uncharacterized protein (DUF1800 family)